MPTLAQVRDPAALDALLGVAVEVLLRAPLSEVVPAEEVAQRVAEALRLVAHEAGVRARVEAEVDSMRATLRRDGAAVATHLPADAVNALDRLAGLRWTPSRDLTLAVLRHDAVRALLREVLAGTVATLVARLRSTTAAIPRPTAGSGLFGGLVATVGSAAEGLAAAASRELDARLHDRLDGFVEGAVESTLEAIAGWIADPRHDAATAALRRSAVAVVLARPVGALVAELDGVPTPDLVAAALDGLRADDLGEVASRTLARLDGRSVAEVVVALGGRPLLDAVRSGAVEALRPAARAVLDSGAFAAWWDSLSS